MKMENGIRDLITYGADAMTIKEAARKHGMRTLFENGIDKVSMGLTTLDEVIRVTQQ